MIGTYTDIQRRFVPNTLDLSRWKALISESEAAIGQCLVPKINMDLAPFIRCITFRVFLVVFLGVDAATLAPPDVLRVTGALTNFYNDEEAKSTIPPEVQRILYEWLPSEHFPFSLDRILPAYEALWRIIATLVVTCKDDETNDLRWVMLDFRDNPRDRQYTASFRTDRKSVSDITEGVARITPIARSTQHASTSTWPLSCIQYASPKSCGAGYAPTVQEGLKFAALLASKIIGRIGVHYGITGIGTTGSHASPWDQRKIYEQEVRSPLGQVPINAAEICRSHSNSSNQTH